MTSMKHKFARVAPLLAGIALAWVLLSAAQAETLRVISAAENSRAPEWLSPHLTSELRGWMGRFEPDLLESIARTFVPGQRGRTFALEGVDGLPFTVQVQEVKLPSE